MAACAATRVAFMRRAYTDSYELYLFVPGMLRPLQDWRVILSGVVVRDGGPHAIAQHIGEVADSLHKEREARRWFAIDP
jgi:hypothetical protein